MHLELSYDLNQNPILLLVDGEDGVVVVDPKFLINVLKASPIAILKNVLENELWITQKELAYITQFPRESIASYYFPKHIKPAIPNIIRIKVTPGSKKSRVLYTINPNVPEYIQRLRQVFSLEESRVVRKKRTNRNPYKALLYNINLVRLREILKLFRLKTMDPDTFYDETMKLYLKATHIFYDYFY